MPHRDCGEIWLFKVQKIICGGEQRYHSVWNGLKETKAGYVYIHDGARPFVNENIIRRGYECVVREHACAAGMPVKIQLNRRRQ